MGNASYVYTKHFNEGTSFSTEEKGITYLYREPSYPTPPATTTQTYGNTTLAQPGGYVPSCLYDLRNTALETQCNEPTYPAKTPTRVYAGLNSISFASNAKVGQWATLMLRYSYYTSSMGTTDFKIVFADGAKHFVKDAVENGYLSPLCLFIGDYPYSDTNWINLYTSGDLAVKNYPANTIVCKPLLSDITGVEFTASNDADWGGYQGNLMDGFVAYTYDPSVQFSLTPIISPKRILKIKYYDTEFKTAKSDFRSGTNWNRINA